MAGDAQRLIEPKTPAATRTVNFTLEQRHVIQELVKDLKVASAESDSKVAAGDEIPAKVELHPVPPLLAEKVPQIKAHRLRDAIADRPCRPARPQSGRGHRIAIRPARAPSLARRS
jgi:hypothetical protein